MESKIFTRLLIFGAMNTAAFMFSQSTENDNDSDGACDHTCIIIISTVVPTTCVIIGLCVYLFIFRFYEFNENMTN